MYRELGRKVTRGSASPNAGALALNGIGILCGVNCGDSELV